MIEALNVGVAMKKIIGLGMAVACSFALAGNGIDPGQLKYKEWGGNKPKSITVISGQVGRNLRLFGETFGQGVDWRDRSGNSITPMRNQICALERGSSCKPWQPYGLSVLEAFLGDASEFRPAPESSDARLGVKALEHIGAGAKKVLLLRIIEGSIPRESLTIAFDDNVSDDDLRQLALEEGVYRVLRFRED